MKIEGGSPHSSPTHGHTSPTNPARDIAHKVESTPKGLGAGKYTFANQIPDPATAQKIQRTRPQERLGAGKMPSVQNKPNAETRAPVIQQVVFNKIK